MDPIEKNAQLADSFASAFNLDSPVTTTSKVSDNGEITEKGIEEDTKQESVLNFKTEDKNVHHNNMNKLDHKEMGVSAVKSKYLPLLNIPEIALEKILSYLTFDQVAQMRLTCRR